MAYPIKLANSSFINYNKDGTIKDCNLENLVYLGSQFAGNKNLVEIKANFLNLKNADSLFYGTTNLKNADVKFPSLVTSISLFQSSGLEAPIINKILSTLPAYTDGLEHIIKFTGCPGASTCDTSIAISKGWTVQI